MNLKYTRFLIFFTLVGLFSACSDISQRQLPVLKSHKYNNVEGRFVADFEGTPSTQMVRGLSPLSPSSGVMGYDLKSYTLPSDAKLSNTDPLYNKSLAGDQYRIFLYATCMDATTQYNSGLIEGVAQLKKDGDKVKISVSAKFDLKKSDGTKLASIDGKTVTLTGLIGGKKIDSTKVFISGPSNTLKSDKIINVDNSEFMPPVVLVKKDIVAHGNGLGFNDGVFQLYGAILGFKIQNNFAGSIQTSEFRIKTNAYSRSGALDLSQYNKQDGKLIHLASDSLNNLASATVTTLAPGVTARNVRDKELVTDTLSEDGATVFSPNNFAYISYVIDQTRLDKGKSSGMVYTWGMPNSYPVNSLGEYEKKELNNVCNEIYGSVTTTDRTTEGSTPFVLINKQHFKPASTNTVLDPALKNNASTVMTITLGGTAEDDNTPDLMFRRVYLGNFRYVLTSNPAHAGSQYTTIDGKQVYRYSNYTTVYDKQMNMIEVYNPTNHACDMTRYFLMSYSDYKKGVYTYKSIRSSIGLSNLQDLGNALMAPLAPRSGKTAPGSSIDTRQVTLGQEFGPAFREASLDYYRAELNGKTGQELFRIDNPNYSRFAAITFYNETDGTSYDETKRKLGELSSLKAGHSIVYAGPGVWMWMKFNKDRDKEPYYCWFSPDDFQPFNESNQTSGGKWDIYKDNRSTTTLVAINDAFCNRTQQIIANDGTYYGNYHDNRYEKSQIVAGWPALPSNVEKTNQPKASWWFDYQYEGISPTPDWRPGVFGISAGQGLMLVKMEKKTFVSKNNSGNLVAKQIWVPVIVDVTPFSPTAYYKELGDEYYGPWYQDTSKGDDFKPSFNRKWLVKNKPKFYPSPDINNQNHTWTITDDRNVGGGFGDKSWN